jgi:hypothetical protein
MMDYLSVQDICFVGKSGGCIGKEWEGEKKKRTKVLWFRKNEWSFFSGL